VAAHQQTLVLFNMVLFIVLAALAVGIAITSHTATNALNLDRRSLDRQTSVQSKLSDTNRELDRNAAEIAALMAQVKDLCAARPGCQPVVIVAPSQPRSTTTTTRPSPTTSTTSPPSTTTTTKPCRVHVDGTCVADGSGSTTSTQVRSRR